MLKERERFINNIRIDFENKESQYIERLNELQNKLEDKNKQHKDIYDRYEKLEKEYYEMVRGIPN